MERFKDKTVLITDAGSGIGKSLALSFAEEGARVVLCGESFAKVKEVEEEIGERAMAVSMDASSLKDWKKTVLAVHERFGKIHILINNAGIADQTPFEYLTEETFRTSLEANLMSVFYSYKTAAEDMKELGWGRICNVSSLAGHRASGDHAAYAASKHAVNGLTKTAAYAFAKYHILTNAIEPGAMDTPMLGSLRSSYPDAIAQIENGIPLGRMATPDDLSGLVKYLCSEENTFVNGVSIPIDGGQYA